MVMVNLIQSTCLNNRNFMETIVYSDMKNESNLILSINISYVENNVNFTFYY